MFKRNLIVLMVLSLTVWALAGAGVRQAGAFDPTIPTRTPTPDPNQPPPSPTTGSQNPGDPAPPTSPAQPTATSAPGGAAPGPATATATTQAGSNVSPPPLLGGTVRANPGSPGSCNDTPYVQAIGQTVVYRGPGSDYVPVSTLQPGEMRPIVGRAQYAQWWQIWLDSGSIGWVDDVEVKEFGDTGLVPVVDPPAINGATPTPGALWNPTPLPLLTCVPTPTPTHTPTTPPTATATVSDRSSDDDLTPTAEMVLADVGPTPALDEDILAGGGEEPGIQGSGISSRGTDASRAASPTSATNLLLPLAGLGLIAGGIALALLSRSKGGQKPDAVE